MLSPTQTAEAAVHQRESRLKSAEHAMVAELAEDKETFIDAMYAYLDDLTELSDALNAQAKTMGGAAREEAEDAVSAIRRRHFRVAQRLAEVRHASGDQWSERTESVAAARAELERKADAALKTLGSRPSGGLAAMGPILLCYDGSAQADRAIRCAGALLRPKNAIVLSVPQKPFKNNVAEAGRRVALAAGFDPLAVLDVGHRRIAAAVLEQAQSRNASVIVVGSPGRVPSPLGLLDAVVDQAESPVLIGPPAAAPSLPNEPIFMCYDGSREARRALAAAGDLLAGRAASVAAFMPAVDDLALLRSSLPWSVSADVQDRLAALDRQEAEAPGQRAGEGARIAATAGFVARPLPIPAMNASSEEEEEPWRRLLRAAADEAAACIVAGHRAASKGFAGTAYGLVHHADRPVLIIPGAP